MSTSLNPEDITVVQSAGPVSSAHDNSKGWYDDSDSNNSGGADFWAKATGGYWGPIDDHD
ncbi:hypothetical protein ACIGZJ_23470 [Kitasatospora sp. NPDC052868]|uniref:hypothetical protein n=1 Tax=Kitasatospora TaxID=2063 RepID=UPI003250221A